MSIYDYTVKTESGSSYSLAKYRGKVLLIVNTATKCGFAPQFAELQELYADHEAAGLVVLGFPSNQFKQELDSSSEAAESCRTTYGVTFPMHEIADVNGEAASPLFKYLQDEQPGALGKAIKWNFTKFLVDREGNVVERYAPKTTPKKMEPEIMALLNK